MEIFIKIFSVFPLFFKIGSVPVKATVCLWASWAMAWDRVLPVYHSSKALLLEYKVQTGKKYFILMFKKKKKQLRRQVGQAKEQWPNWKH